MTTGDQETLPIFEAAKFRFVRESDEKALKHVETDPAIVPTRPDMLRLEDVNEERRVVAANITHLALAQYLAKLRLVALDQNSSGEKQRVQIVVPTPPGHEKAPA